MLELVQNKVLCHVDTEHDTRNWTRGHEPRTIACAVCNKAGCHHVLEDAHYHSRALHLQSRCHGHGGLDTELAGRQTKKCLLRVLAS